METTSLTLNTSINEFYTGLTGNISSTFTGTPFAAPALDVVHCLIGTKVEGLSTALTWLHENAHVSLPQVKDNIFALSDDASNELVSSLDGGEGGDDSTSSSIVKTLVDQYRRALEKERLVFLFMLGLYGLVVFFAAIAVFWHEIVTPRWKRRRGDSPDHSSTILYTEKSGFEPSIKSTSFLAAASANLRGSLSAFKPRKRQASAESVLTEKDKVASFQFPVRPFPKRPASKPPTPRASSIPASYHQGTESTANLLAPSASPPLSSALRQSRAAQAPVEPELSLPYLYGAAAPAVAPYPARSSAARSSHGNHLINPFVTPFDGPNGS